MICPLVWKLVERVALDNRIGLLQARLSRKELESVPHLSRIRRHVVPGTIRAELRPHASRCDHFRFGSEADVVEMSAPRPLTPQQQTYHEPDADDRYGPQPEGLGSSAGRITRGLNGRF